MQITEQKSRLQLIICSFLIIFMAYSNEAKAQNIIQKLVGKVFSTEKDSTRSAVLMVLPALGYAQETGVEYGAASNYNFYLNKKDPNIRSSNILLMGTYTSNKQMNLKLQTDLWTENNDYHIISEIRYRNWPFNFYGIGMETHKIDEDVIRQKLFRAKIEIEKKIAPQFYTGIHAQYDYFKFQDMESGGIYDSTAIAGKSGGQQLLLGLSQSFDNRNNVNYPTKGFFAKAKISFAPKLWTAEDFKGTQIEADFRTYIPLDKKLVLGLQGLYKSTLGNTTPFYTYRELGGDMMMRGYYVGRYRDKNYIASQAELRYRFHPRFGIVGFSGVGSTFSQANSIRLAPSYGAGARYFFSLEHNSSIRIDYAFGEKRAGEKRQSGFYISLSEAF